MLKNIVGKLYEAKGLMNEIEELGGLVLEPNDIRIKHVTSYWLEELLNWMQENIENHENCIVRDCDGTPLGTFKELRRKYNEK